MQEDLKNWTPCAPPHAETLHGRHVVLTAYRNEDIADLWACFGETDFNTLARYFPNPDFSNVDAFGAWLENAQNSWRTMVFRDPATQKPIGMASYMRIDPANGSIEVGAVCHSPQMQRTIAATEAHYLMAKYIFDDLGYRRYEWKLNNNNEASHAAAKRLGFTFEGIFRNHIVSKGENRDTAWYSMINSEWQSRKKAFEAWLDPANFDSQGNQIKKLQNLR